MTGQDPTEPQANQQEEIGQIRGAEREKKSHCKENVCTFFIRSRSLVTMPSSFISSLRWIIWVGLVPFWGFALMFCGFKDWVCQIILKFMVQGNFYQHWCEKIFRAVGETLPGFISFLLGATWKSWISPSSF